MLQLFIRFVGSSCVFFLFHAVARSWGLILLGCFFYTRFSEDFLSFPPFSLFIFRAHPSLAPPLALFCFWLFTIDLPIRLTRAVGVRYQEFLLITSVFSLVTRAATLSISPLTYAIQPLDTALYPLLTHHISLP